jgi:AcrR family transcriptional regulator
MINEDDIQGEDAGDEAMPAAKPYHHGDLRNALIKRAAEVLEESGADDLSLRSLAKDVGVAHPAVYRHFADKQELMATVLEQAYRRLAQDYLVKAASEDPILRLQDIAAAYLEFAFDYPNTFLAMGGRRLNVTEKFEGLEKAIDANFAPTKAAVRQAQDAGLFASDDTRGLAAYYWGALLGVVEQIIRRRIRLSPENRDWYIRQIARRIIAGLAVDA